MNVSRAGHVAPATFLAIALTAYASPSPASASPYSDINQAAATSPITVYPLRGGVSMLEGSGGNIGVLADVDGMLLVDTGIAVSQAKIEAALAGLSKGPIRYAVNTHWHWDHTDGNAWVHRAGAEIVAARNAAEHLQQTLRVVEWEHTFTPVEAAARPAQTISAEKIIAMGDERVRIRPYHPGHTDGDLSVYFQRANVLVTGDTLWNGVYPFIDYVGGGGIDGAIRAAEANLTMSGPATIIIPGHGPVASRDDLKAFRDMLVEIRRRVASLKAQGKTLAEVQAAKPTADYDGKWGGSIINGELFTALVYRGV
ncbi:MBL fold metallo-hydrolase [Phenylobacterium koreense]|uniref:Glyoxylase-like metal-dependent hydrolase (Beta-lactamase superfamily II) n=1 Tax=Phenylobacterium koreense TaxID=266125 RepID=A0ABV2EN88_9CAUL